MNADVDTISYVEMEDYIQELGYSPNCKFSIWLPNNCILGDIDKDIILLRMCNTLQNKAILVVYMHMTEEESSVTFNKVCGITRNSVSEYIGDDEVVGKCNTSNFCL